MRERPPPSPHEVLSLRAAALALSIPTRVWRNRFRRNSPVPWISYAVLLRYHAGTLRGIGESIARVQVAGLAAEPRSSASGRRLPLFVLALVPATLTADERVGPLAERFTADDAGPRWQWVLGAVLNSSPFVVLGEVLGILFPPLASAIGATTTAPTLESASEFRIRSKRLERKPLAAGTAPLARISRQVESPASRVSLSRRVLGRGLRGGKPRRVGRPLASRVEAHTTPSQLQQKEI
jgi:hypothetical protein